MRLTPVGAGSVEA